MKTLYNSAILLLCFFCISKLSAQDPTVEWVRFYDGPAATFDEAYSIEYYSAEGSVVVAGRGVDTEGGINVFIVKYDSNGDVMWDYIWDGPSGFDDTAWDIVIAPNGNVYICGQTKTGEGYWDSNMFLLALDVAGNYLWEDTYGLFGAYLDIAYELRLDNEGNVYMVGTDDQGETNNLFSGGIMRRYTPDGVCDWTIHHNASTVEYYADALATIDIDVNQNVILGGSTTLLNTGYDMAVMSYNQDGSQLWIHTNPGPLNNVTESFIDVETDQAGNVYALGYNALGEWEVVKYDVTGVEQWTYVMTDLYFGSYYLGTDYMVMDNNSNLVFAVEANGDVYITQLSPNGDQNWQTIWNSPSGFSDEVYHMVKDIDDNYYVAGKAGFDNGYFDMMMLKFDYMGNLVWDMNYNGSYNNTDEAHCIVVVGSAIYLVGYSTGDMSNADFTVVKYAQVVSVEENEKETLFVYPNPATDRIRVEGSIQSNSSYSIINSLGAVVMKGQISSKGSIDVAALKSGVYIVEVGGSQQKVVIR